MKIKTFFPLLSNTEKNGKALSKMFHDIILSQLVIIFHETQRTIKHMTLLTHNTKCMNSEDT